MEFKGKELIGLDFETYSGVDLIRHGLTRYARTESFRPLIASLAWGPGGWNTRRLDFVRHPEAKLQLASVIKDRIIVAHNAGFEREVLRQMGIKRPADSFIDSAVVARMAGAGGKLEAAAPQLLDTDKMEAGQRLIKLFSVPGKYQEENGNLLFDPRIVEDNPDDWLLFADYCEVDAMLGLRIVQEIGLPQLYSEKEHEYAAITMEMSETGWPVDVDSVQEMQRRYLENQEEGLQNFRAHNNAAELNLNSLQQMKAWCLERGIRASSFDEKNVEKMAARIDKKLNDMDPFFVNWQGYREVLHLLRTKQLLAGSSLKKLQVILDTVADDGRLRDQYIHCGAGQTYRTTGRSVQMQNLKRLASPMDMAELQDPGSLWSNEELAENIRQGFTSNHPKGQLIVCDLASVESRGLAWFACEQYKLDAYRHGKDMYKVLAGQIYLLPYVDVTKSQRQTGKVGELSCGYGAGGEAVRAFAENMGVNMSEAEAAKLVSDWRHVNPMTVELWKKLDDALHTWMVAGAADVAVGQGYRLHFSLGYTPASLTKLHPNARTLELNLFDNFGRLAMSRVFHGCHSRGRNIGYYKPSKNKTGDLWVNHYMDPKTKQVKFYSIYGGKLSGILTQSFCRQLFFEGLARVDRYFKNVPNVQLIGQFHDEIVLDWQPGGITLPEAMNDLRSCMINSPPPGFPMEAEVKADYRYIK